ncbi:MAG: DNA translocase FtsK 4TM domain-containing protein [bacterium]
MRRRRRRRNLLDYIRLPSLPEVDLDSETKKGVFIVLIVALGTIGLLGLFGKAGMIGEYFNSWLILGFGWGKWLVPMILIFWGYMLYSERFDVRGINYFGLILFIFSFHSLLFLLIEQNQWDTVLEIGRGGGYAGLFLAELSIKYMGLIASFIVLFCFVIISFLLIFNATLMEIFGPESYLARLFYPLIFLLKKVFSEREEEEDDDEDEEEDDEKSDDEEEEEEEEEDDHEENEEEHEEDEEEEEETGAPEFVAKSIKEKKQIEEVWWKPTGIKIDLPLGLLKGRGGKPTSGDIKENKEIIRRSLEHFGIDVEMGDVSVGPTVTQYTFKPAEGVKLSRITNLSNDLALALAAHPIRIEAPIPGKSLVGVEVPNQAKVIVGLREILKAKSSKKNNHNMMLALGKDVSGNPWFGDITKMPHLLVAGATNSGKSVCLNTIIVSLMYQNNPDDLRFVMVDPKRVEFQVYNNIPYLLCPVVTDIGKTVNALKWCLNEMDRRFDILSNSGHRNIQSYNESIKIKMPYIVVVIDELADLMAAAAKDIESGVIRLAQMSRAVGIHLVLATQRPSVDVITGLIKANMPARIAFSVASGTDSRTILDILGAEKLLGRGDMLFVDAEMSKPVRLQGAFLSDEEIKKIIRHVKRQSDGQTCFIDAITDRQKVKGFDGVGFGGSGDDDELLSEAKETVINMNRASASLLQRKLRIGYARAASILDALEAEGVISAGNGSKPREVLVSREEYEAGLSQGISGVSLHKKEEADTQKSYLGEESDTSLVFDPSASSGQDDDEEDEEDDYEENESEHQEDVEEEEEEEEEKKGSDEKDEDDDEDEGKYFSR